MLNVAVFYIYVVSILKSRFKKKSHRQLKYRTKYTKGNIFMGFIRCLCKSKYILSGMGLTKIHSNKQKRSIHYIPVVIVVNKNFFIISHGLLSLNTNFRKNIEKFFSKYIIKKTFSKLQIQYMYKVSRRKYLFRKILHSVE